MDCEVQHCHGDLSEKCTSFYYKYRCHFSWKGHRALSFHLLSTHFSLSFSFHYVHLRVREIESFVAQIAAEVALPMHNCFRFAFVHLIPFRPLH